MLLMDIVLIIFIFTATIYETSFITYNSSFCSSFLFYWSQEWCCVKQNHSNNFSDISSDLHLFKTVPEIASKSYMHSYIAVCFVSYVEL